MVMRGNTFPFFNSFSIHQWHFWGIMMPVASFLGSCTLCSLGPTVQIWFWNIAPVSLEKAHLKKDQFFMFDSPKQAYGAAQQPKKTIYWIAGKQAHLNNFSCNKKLMFCNNSHKYLCKATKDVAGDCIVFATKEGIQELRNAAAKEYASCAHDNIFWDTRTLLLAM